MDEVKTKRKKSEETPLSGPPAAEAASPQIGERDLGGGKAEVYFTSVMWKGVKEVFKCATCGECRDTRDEIVEHVLLHFPKGEQERIFEELMKEK